MIVRLTTYMCVVALFASAFANKACHTDAGQKSCGQCIKQNPECGWCTGPTFTGTYRCDSKDNLVDGGCNPDNVYHPKAEIEKKGDRKVGEMKSDGVTKFQLRPQQVRLRMKQGETLDFDVTYLFLDEEPREITVMNSETSTHGVSIKYKTKCENAVDDRTCKGSLDEKVQWTASVTLDECKTSGDIVISVGLGGHRDVIALYITPLCGCSCENAANIEQRSPSCSNSGTLTCGVCVCNQGFVGVNCGCREGEESSTDDSTCRKDGGDVCSGKGDCKCGQCKCKDSFISGKFCECDATSCPKSAGALCGGKGECNCGMCKCQTGWSGEACDCDESTDMCETATGICSGNGACKCNKCECDADHEGEQCQTALDEPKEVPHKSGEVSEENENGDSEPEPKVPKLMENRYISDQPTELPMYTTTGHPKMVTSKTPGVTTEKVVITTKTSVAEETTVTTMMTKPTTKPTTTTEAATTTKATPTTNKPVAPKKSESKSEPTGETSGTVLWRSSILTIFAAFIIFSNLK